MAISPVDSVPVDVTGWDVRIIDSRPAVRRERNGAGEWVETPKVRDGVAGVEIDCLAAIPGIESRRSLKFTLYTPIPDGLEAFTPVGLVGPVMAAPWATGTRSGLWFEVSGIEPVGTSTRRRGGE
ncbi:hypothetical protein ACPXCG_03440 [Gordonia sp. DT218]|uniref:hypothetical protein n=1 Tax=Gordonia sp. DT218 TaxID=3416659 RepID=UPI003CF80141